MFSVSKVRARFSMHRSHLWREGRFHARFLAGALSTVAAEGPSLALLERLSAWRDLRPETWYLIAAATATSLGRGHSWVPAIYKYAAKSFGPAPSVPTLAPSEFISDPLPRRKVVRRLKETIVKSIIFVGVPRAIQTTFALITVLEPGDKDSSFVRAGLDVGEENVRRGLESTYRVYRDPLPISGEVAEAMRDIEWISCNVTYGLLLGPILETTPTAPLTFPETEMVIISCLIAQYAHKEVTWHIRGALRSGLSENEVEAIQGAIELIASECGVDVKTGMPRVRDVIAEGDAESRL